MQKESRFRGSLLGLAVGDCLGVPAEFLPLGSFPLISDMTGGGPFHLEKGEWTDDTSMALCLAESLIACRDFQLKDQIDRYVRWYQKGENSSKGVCFDIGTTVSGALERYMKTGNPLSGSEDPATAGNGSVMRLAPVPLVWSYNRKEAAEYSGESSRTTHQAVEAVDGCRFYGMLIAGAVQGCSKEELLSFPFVEGLSLSPRINDIAKGSYKHKQPPEIKGTGYVVDSIEAAFWAFYHGRDFSEGLLLAVNLGNDADTTGAIYGQLAGTYYGYEAIPAHWIDALVDKERIDQMAKDLYDVHLILSAEIE
ncbi:MAG TPA: ADP-ribosylglycohydrolase family protein [Bacillota bacterium]|nr:ADP-ribosylglycohydrolase family protein [Bacillota bacterium]